MQSHYLSVSSLDRLTGVHSDLVRMVVLALRWSEVDFAVIEGRRTQERQQQLFEDGKTQTLNSRHLTGHAVDLAPIVGGRIPWDDWSKFELVADAMTLAAEQLSIPIEWGGNWQDFQDGPHFQIPWESYDV